MKNQLNKLAVGAAFALCVGPAFAAPLYALDTKIGSTALSNSGDPAEEAYLEGLVDEDLVFDKVDTGLKLFLNESDPLSWYLDVTPEKPGYFLLKFGAGSSTGHTHYAFENIADLTKLVFSQMQIDGLVAASSCTTPGVACGVIEKLSHYVLASVDGENPPGGNVPEPGSLALLGLGLAGLGLLRRRNLQA